MSGLCLSAFILALVLSVLGLMTLWVALAIPLVLSVWALATVDGARFRGRALAGWALGISLVVGWFSFQMASSLNSTTATLAQGVVAVLRAQRPDAERHELLGGWTAPHAERERTIARMAQRYQDAVERLGAPTGGPLVPSLLGGQFGIMVPPARVVAVDAPDALDAVPAPGRALWVRLPFERAVAHLALVVGDGSATSVSEALHKLTAEGPAAVLHDLRFFVEKGVLDKPAPPR
jgi:hypothetical protein